MLMSGIGRIEILCDLEPGEAGITAAKVLRLRARVCRRIRCDEPSVVVLPSPVVPIGPQAAARREAKSARAGVRFRMRGSE